ncbi:hypothetical protein [Moraxella oblonga]|uniref:hypothetical protein n=1 Tax=Moraxella oblonga TaxID=200413 RepID=UPI00082E53D6|nr:hypothetical protein [Moraxella oblonga]
MSADKFWNIFLVVSTVIGFGMNIYEIFVIRRNFATIFQRRNAEKLFKISYVLLYGAVTYLMYISAKIYSTRCVLPNDCSGSDVLGEAIFAIFVLSILVGFFLLSWVYFLIIPSTKFLRRNSDFADKTIQSWKRWKIAILILTIAMPILFYLGFVFIVGELTPVPTTPEA